jgi:hypothetical protein
MLRCNPLVLELSEFFVGLDWNRRFQGAPLTGVEYAEILKAPHPLVTLVLQRGYLPAEVSYPFGRPAARFSSRDPIPWPLAAAFPPLSQDPDRLWDEAVAFVMKEPAQSPEIHARRLFGFLVKRLDKTSWVERSAGSLTYLADLDRAFPKGKFLHLHRQGEDAALSMREHPVFRLAVMLTYQIPLGDAGSNDILASLAGDADHVSRLIASRPRAEYFGRWWSEQIRVGVEVGRRLGPERYREVAFESLTEDPEGTLREIAEFLELPNPSGWRSHAVKLIDPARGGGAPADPSEIESLAVACAAGNALLGRSPRVSA